MKIPPQILLLVLSGLFMTGALVSPETVAWLAAGPPTGQPAEEPAPAVEPASSLAAPLVHSVNKPPVRMVESAVLVASGPPSREAEEPSRRRGSERHPTADDRYLGGFRVPEDDGSGRSGQGPAYSYSYGGEVAAADGEQLWLSTHARHLFVGPISIPEPAIPSSPEAFQELPLAKALAPAIDVTGGLREDAVQKSKRPMVLGDLVPDHGRLHWVFHHYYNVAQTKYRVLGAFNPRTGAADGPFGIIDESKNPVRDQLSGRYLAAVPEEWAEQVGGSFVCGGGGLPGQATWGAGPNLYAFTPPAAGADPYVTFVESRPLLLYPFDDDEPATRRRSLDGWNRASRPFDVVWIGDSVIFAARLGRGTTWYGSREGPNGVKDWFIKDKTYHAQWYELQFLFYDAEDLAAVARGEKESWQPRPYAMVPVPHLMGDDPAHAQVSPIALSWDPKTERLYVVQGLADRSRSKFARHPVVHVYDLGDIESIRSWAEELSERGE